MKIILWTATFVSLVTYLFWDKLPKGSFYIGNALFIFLLCLVLYRGRRLFITFFLLSISINNLLDEVFFDPTKLGWNELALFIVMPLIWLYMNRNETQHLGGGSSLFF